MLIVLEGTDCAGKSTLANELRRLMPHLLARHSPRPTAEDQKAPVNFFLRGFDLDFEAGFADTALDRWWPSDWVYGPVMDGARRVPVTQAYFLEGWGAAMGAVFVHVKAPVPLLKERLMKDDTDTPEWIARQLSNIENLRDLYDEWFGLARGRGLRTLELDTSETSPAESAEKVSKWLASDAAGLGRRILCGEDTGKAWGGHGPKVLFVGDQVNAVQDHPALRTAPFSDFSGNSCTEWLLTLLIRTGLAPSEVAVANAWRPGREAGDLSRDLVSLTAENVLQIDPAAVILMGRAAQEWVHSDLDLRQAVLSRPHRVMHHPQFYRRFYRHATDSVAEDLRKFLRVRRKDALRKGGYFAW